MKYKFKYNKTSDLKIKKFIYILIISSYLFHIVYPSGNYLKNTYIKNTI